MTALEFSPGSLWSDAAEQAGYVITDRPAYRPGDAISFRAWVRVLKNRRFLQPEAGESVRMTLSGPNHEDIRSQELKTDRWGAITGTFRLGAESALGEYTISAWRRGEDRPSAAASFRVEAYKKPEFEVKVEPVDSLPRLGDKVRFRIQARYYSGEPVRHGRVDYTIIRHDHEVARSFAAAL
jgi:uncharacterized protein YfaS (alpha-2-macroglobulin family)